MDIDRAVIGVNVKRSMRNVANVAALSISHLPLNIDTYSRTEGGRAGYWWPPHGDGASLL
jgi:hypothetical protein